MAETTTAKKKGRPVKAQTDEVEQIATEVVDDEKEALKAQLAELQAQMALMAQMIGNKPTEPAKSNKMITLVNLTNGTLVLRGSRIWTIEGQFNTLTVTETEATVIVSSSNNTIRSGCVYIDDPDFIESHNLSDIYRNILSDDMLKTLLRRNTVEIVDLYKSTSPEQQNIIIDMITERCLRGVEVDANVLKQLSKLTGKDLMSLEPETED